MENTTALEHTYHTYDVDSKIETLNPNGGVYNSGIPFSRDNGSDYHGNDGEFEHASMYLFVVVGVVNVIVFLIGIFGNTMVILVVLRVRAMRNPTNYFFLSLSIADLFVLLVCQPVAMMEFYAMDRWYLGEFMCKLVPLLENGMLHVSILTILAVTTERFYAICYPFKNHANCSETLAVKVIAALWVIAYVCTTPFLVMTELETAVFYDGSEINVCRTKIDELWRRVFVVGNLCAFFALPLLILVYMYAKIIRQLVSDSLVVRSKNDKSAKYTLRSRKQVVRMLILIIILFFASLCPIRVVSLWQIFAPVESIQNLGLGGYLTVISFARIMMYINSAGNPIIYSLSSTKFKTAFKRVLKRYDRSQRNDYRTGRSGSTQQEQIWFRRSKKKKFDIVIAINQLGQAGSGDKRNGILPPPSSSDKQNVLVLKQF